MFASTLDARNLLNLAFEAADAPKPLHTYTEKTSEHDPKRRSVVFPIDSDDADDVATFASDFFTEAGFTSSKPVVTFNKDYSGYIRAYIRVIAYKE